LRDELAGELEIFLSGLEGDPGGPAYRAGVPVLVKDGASGPELSPFAAMPSLLARPGGGGFLKVTIDGPSTALATTPQT